MPKTDPRRDAIQSVGNVTYTVPALYDGRTVVSVTGGSVLRAGTPLAPGNTLSTDQVLQFQATNATTTLTLTLEEANAEFSGRYIDLSGAPAGGGSAGYTEEVLQGNPYPPRQTDDLILTRGIEYVASAAVTVTAVRVWARTPPGSAAPYNTMAVQVIVNDEFRSNVLVDVQRGVISEITATLAQPVSIAVGDRVGVVLAPDGATGVPVPEFLGGYVEAGDDYYALGYAALNGYIDALSVTEPITYERTPDADTGGLYPAVQLLSTTGAPVVLPHATFPAVRGTGGAWTLVDARAADNDLPSIVARHDGQLYQLHLPPVGPTPNLAPLGAYIPRVATTASIGPSRMAWVSGGLYVTDDGGTVYSLALTPE